MNLAHRTDLARTVLRVAAAVLVGGWCSAAVVGLLSWTVAERIAPCRSPTLRRRCSLCSS
jgi:hypothetical protein